MPTSCRHPRYRPSIHAVCGVLVSVAVAACGKDSSGPGPSVVFIKQPSTAIAGEAIQPPVEVMVRSASGRPLEGTVTLKLDPNPCGWHLSGILTRQVIDTTARFGDLALGMVGHGYTLRASAEGASAMSAPFDVQSGISTEPVVLENVVCAEADPRGDGESLTYVPEDDTFWRADDNRNSIFEVDRRTGVSGSEVTLETILETLPDAGACDDGDGDLNTTCSYVEQFEQLSYDPIGRSMYVLNVVDASPPDKPAIFRLTREACAGCFTPESWRPLPEGVTYSAVIAAPGQIYMAVKGRIYEYDYEMNQLATVDANGDSLPPAYAFNSPVEAMSFDGTHMWILTHNNVLHQVEWATRTEHLSYTLDPFGLSLPRGMEVVRDTIYVLEGDPPNPIYVFTQRQP